MTEGPSRESVLQKAHAPGGRRRPWSALAIVGVLVAVFVVGLVDLPRGHAPLPQVGRHAMQIALPDWGQTEVVSAIIYGARGFDTFGETFLLLAAVVSAITVCRAKERRHEYVGEENSGRLPTGRDVGAKHDGSSQRARTAEHDEEHDSQPVDNYDDAPLGTRGPERATGMSVVARVGARVAAVILSVSGIYLAAWGFTPGGGFPAGAIIAGVMLLLYASLGHRAVRAMRPTVLEPIELAGGVAIIVLGVLGIVLQGSMFANFLPLAQPQTIRAGGIEQLYSGAELVEVASGLVIAIFSLLGMRHDWAPADQEDQ